LYRAFLWKNGVHFVTRINILTKKKQICAEYLRQSIDAFNEFCNSYTLRQ